MSKARTAQDIAHRAIVAAHGLLDRTVLRGAEAVRLMADDMRVFHSNAGAVTEADLKVIGWKQSQVTEHGDAARELAMGEAVR